MTSRRENWKPEEKRKVGNKHEGTRDGERYRERERETEGWRK